MGSLLLLSAALTGCASSPILAPRPTQTSSPVALTVPVSSIAIPVAISTAVLAKEMDRRLSERVGEHGIVYRRNVRTPVPGARATFGVHRSGHTSVHAEDGRLMYRVPIALNSGEVDWHGCAPGGACRSVHGEFGGSGVISGETTIRVTEDWGLASRTRFRFSWLEEPWVHLKTTVDHGRVPLHPLVDLLLRAKLRRQLAAYAKRVDSVLAGIDLRRYLEPAWRRIHFPQKLVSDPPMWLCVDGVGAGVGPLLGEQDDLVVRPVLIARLRVHIGAQPIVSNAVPPLPRNSGFSEREQSEVQVPIAIEYAYLNTLLKDRVTGRTFEFKNGAKVTIRDVELSGAGSRLIARVEFDAGRIPSRLIPSASGTVYFSGRPSYDKVTRQLTVQDFDFDVDTQEYLHKAAAWLLQDTFVEQVRQKVVFDVSKKVDPVLARFERNFSTYTLAYGITLTTRLQEVAMEGDPVVGDESVTIVAIAKGSTRIHVEAVPKLESLRAMEREGPTASNHTTDRDGDSDDLPPDDPDLPAP
ncbi:MAG: DUF4403 family protein [Zetaproteobacteria bacterium]|nr:MAG: DUF4403 family protein [Zetaproteobacteria bacterium]